MQNTIKWRQKTILKIPQKTSYSRSNHKTDEKVFTRPNVQKVQSLNYWKLVISSNLVTSLALRTISIPKWYAGWLWLWNQSIFSLNKNQPKILELFSKLQLCSNTDDEIWNNAINDMPTFCRCLHVNSVIHIKKNYTNQPLVSTTLYAKIAEVCCHYSDHSIKRCMLQLNNNTQNL